MGIVGLYRRPMVCTPHPHCNTRSQLYEGGGGGQGACRSVVCPVSSGLVQEHFIPVTLSVEETALYQQAKYERAELLAAWNLKAYEEILQVPPTPQKRASLTRPPPPTARPKSSGGDPEPTFHAQQKRCSWRPRDEGLQNNPLLFGSQ